MDDTENIEIHDVRLAACALFLEMANIDGEFSEDERQEIFTILREEYDLSDEHAAQITEAAEEELEASLDLWKFTNMINTNFSREEKVQVVEFLWRIIYLDGKLNRHEDYLIHKFSRLLRLSHSELIDAKLKVLQQHKNS